MNEDYVTCQRAILVAGGKRIMIMAGQSSQASSWAHGVGLRDIEWRYVADVHTIRGTRHNPYVVIGTFYDRWDHRELEYLAKVFQFVMIEGVDARTWTELVTPLPPRPPLRNEPGYAPGEPWFE